MSEAMLGQPSETHPRRDAFVDHWGVEGESNADHRQADDARVHEVANASEDGCNEEIYEWAPNGCFLKHRWDATLGESAYKGTEILEYQPVRGDYFTRFFDRSGNCSERTALVDGKILMFKAANTSATVAVTEDGNALDIACEWREDGSDWSPMLGLLARCG